ncbi:MAG TPA: hypothetical protein VES67_23345 [Vicinamibacterales bacterium]|nr:hypothetical protein [Vicinamibacterales bacterium]
MATGASILFAGQVLGLLPGDQPLPGADLDDRIFQVAIAVVLATIAVLIARRRPPTVTVRS